MAATFKLKIITPSGIYREEEDVEILNVRTIDGQMGILAHRLPLATGLEISEMNYVVKGKREHFSIAGGFMYVGEHETSIIANSIESQDEIDLRRAEEAKARAEGRLKSPNPDIDIARAEIALKKAITRIDVKNWK